VLSNLALVVLLLSIASELRSFVLLLTRLCRSSPVVKVLVAYVCVTLLLELVR
jgi:hypothetical protein